MYCILEMRIIIIECSCFYPHFNNDLQVLYKPFLNGKHLHLRRDIYVTNDHNLEL